MEIIALKGNSDCGKSKTLNIAYQFLLLFGYTQVLGHYRQLGNPNQYDFLDIIEKKGLKVGFVTMGDYQNTSKKFAHDSVENLINYLIASGCDKIVCGVNTNLTHAINHISTFKHTFIDKTITVLHSEQRFKNGEDAEKIYKLI